MVKVHKLVAAIATTITLSTTSAYALELGDISWQSSFGQPLKAKIALKDIAGIKASEINSTLSNRVKVDDLPSLSFNPVILDNGSGYIEVTSSVPVKEPFLTFAVDVKYNGNTLTKEYNVLLDMPDTSTSINKANPKPSTKPVANVTQNNANSTYRTSRGETLWIIAQKSYGANLTARAAKAIYDKNPKAFINGQHTQILADYTLTLPSTQEVKAISVADANTFISGKAVTPKTTTTAVKAPEKVDNKAAQVQLQQSEQALADARSENEQLSSQLENLQSEIDRLETISKEKDIQINEIKEKIATQPVQNTTKAQSTTPIKDDITDATQTVPDQTSEIKPASEPKPETIVQTKPVPEPKKPIEEIKAPADAPTQITPKKEPIPTPVQQPEPIADEPSFLSSLLANQTLMMAGGGGLVLLCLLGLLLRRKKAMKDDDAEELDLSNVSLDDDGQEPAISEKVEEKNNEDSVSQLGEGMGVLDKVDVYLLYHHYEQAKALLKTAIEEDPTNTEYYLKLLEILAETDDTNAFNTESEYLLLIDPMAQHKIDAIKTKYNIVSAVSPQKQTASPSDDAQKTVLDKNSTTDHDIQFNQDNFNTSAEDFTPSFSFSKNDEPQEQGLQKEEEFSFDTSFADDTEKKVIEEAIDDTTNDFGFDINPKDSPLITHTEQPTIAKPSDEERVEAETDENDIMEKDQVATKLELVNAYINMNDDEGAKDLLEEIIKEGNESQKSEAQRLMASLTGNSVATQETTVTATKEENVPVDSSTINHDDKTLTELDLGFALSPEDEVVTKLELAKAYIDMGDKIGAKDILEEVLSEGSELQKQEALELIHSLN